MKTPWVIAHRGASGHAPENTITAFQRAVELGASFVETDLHVTRDGAFVAIHDDTVDRTTNGSGEVADFTLEELRRADSGMWFDREFLGERVPALPEILHFAEVNDVIFYLELKYPAVAGMDHALAAALNKANAMARTIVISFDPATLAPLRRIDPAIMVGLLVENADPECIQKALDLGARQICPKFSLVNPALIEQAHRADLQVVTWTVNSADQMRLMIATGVDGIMTDFPDRLAAIIEDASMKKEAQ